MKWFSFTQLWWTLTHVETYSTFSLRLQLSSVIPLRSRWNTTTQTSRNWSVSSHCIYCAAFWQFDCHWSICLHLSWGRSIWACDCIVAKWIWNWYWSPGLPKSRHYSFDKKAENIEKGEQKVRRGELCHGSLFFFFCPYEFNDKGRKDKQTNADK